MYVLSIFSMDTLNVLSYLESDKCNILQCKTNTFNGYASFPWRTFWQTNV